MIEQFLARWLKVFGKTGFPECVDPLYKLSWEIDDSRVKTARMRVLVVCNFIYHLLRSGVSRPWAKPKPGLPGFKGFGPIGVYTRLLSLENDERAALVADKLRKYQVSTFFKQGSILCSVTGNKQSCLSITLNMVARNQLDRDIAALKGFLFTELPPELENRTKMVGKRAVSVLPFPKMLMTESSIKFATIDTNPKMLAARSKSSLVFRFEFDVPFDIADWAPPRVQQKMLRETFLKSWRARK